MNKFCTFLDYVCAFLLVFLFITRIREFSNIHPSLVLVDLYWVIYGLFFTIRGALYHACKLIDFILETEGYKTMGKQWYNFGIFS